MSISEPISKPLRQVISCISKIIETSLVNDPEYILSEKDSEEITEDVRKNEVDVKKLYVEIVKIGPKRFKEIIDKYKSLKSLISAWIPVYSNLLLYADYLNDKFDLNLKSDNEILLEAALRGTPNYNPSPDSILPTGFENTKRTLSKHELFT